MDNELTLSTSEQKLTKVYNMLMAAVEKPLSATTQYYGKVLERQLDSRQTLALLNAQLAFAMTVLPADCHLLLRAVCAWWLFAAVQKCRQLL